MVIKKNLEKIFIPLISVICAFLVGSVLIVIVGRNPLVAYGYLLQGAFGSLPAIGETLLKATPLIFTSLSAVFAYRCNMFNLGAEGQFIMGSVAAVWFSLTCTMLPRGLGILGAMVLGIIAGALWGAVPGILKAVFHLNEMIVSILLNYIAVLFMSFLYCGPMMEANIPQTAAISESVRLTRFLGGSRVHTGLFIALGTAALIYYFLFHTYSGYQFRAVGLNPVASKVNGFPVRRMIIIALTVSGAVAGLGGATELMGNSFRLQQGYANGFGFDGVAIALIGQLHPIGAIFVAYLFAVLRCGANTMQVGTGIPTAVVDIIEATIIVFAVAGTAIVHLPELRSLINKFRGKREGRKAL